MKCAERIWIELADRMRTFQYDPKGTFRGWLRRICEYCPECKAVLERLAHRRPDATSVLPGPERWPRIPGFEIQSELGRGAMGVVYLAIETGLDRLVALKILPGALGPDADWPSPPLAAQRRARSRASGTPTSCRSIVSAKRMAGSSCVAASSFSPSGVARFCSILADRITSSGGDELLVFHIVKIGPRRTGEMLHQRTKTVISVTLPCPLQHIEQLRPGFGQGTVLRRRGLDHESVTPDSHVMCREIDEPIVLDLSGSHQCFFTGEQRDHFDELPERISGYKRLSSARASISRLHVSVLMEVCLPRWGSWTGRVWAVFRSPRR